MVRQLFLMGVLSTACLVLGCSQVPVRTAQKLPVSPSQLEKIVPGDLVRIELISEKPSSSVTIEGLVSKVDSSEISLKECSVEGCNHSEVPILADIPPLKRYFSSAGVGIEKLSEFSVSTDSIASLQKLENHP